MAAFEFRLDTVLRFQERQKKLAELRRSQALQALLRAEAEVVRLQQEMRQLAVAMEACVGRAEHERWGALHSHSQWLTNQLAAAERRVPPAQAAFLQSNERFRQVARLVEALVNLREQRWRAFSDERARAEQQRVEEIVLRRWREATAARESDWGDTP
jgi:flagellar export protein FliJ